jgi:hypothetical protein
MRDSRGIGAKAEVLKLWREGEQKRVREAEPESKKPIKKPGRRGTGEDDACFAFCNGFACARAKKKSGRRCSLAVEAGARRAGQARPVRSDQQSKGTGSSMRVTETTVGGGRYQVES